MVKAEDDNVLEVGKFTYYKKMFDNKFSVVCSICGNTPTTLAWYSIHITHTYNCIPLFVCYGDCDKITTISLALGNLPITM